MKNYDPDKKTNVSRRRLPHWEQEGCVYFVTFRLADSLPKKKLEDWKTRRERWLKSRNVQQGMSYQDILEALSEDERREYYRIFWKGYHDMLDAGYGACWLKSQEFSQIVKNAFLFFDKERYLIGDFVVMPNHVHVLVEPLGEESLERVLHSWKRFTAREINKKLERTGQVWQHESYDHIVRDEGQLKRIQKYIANNPQNLREGEFVYYKSGNTL